MSQDNLPVLIVCAKIYNGKELWSAIKVLQEHNRTFVITSHERVITEEQTSKRNLISIPIYDVVQKDYSGLLVISGPLPIVKFFWKDTSLIFLISSFHQVDKPVGAICCAAPCMSYISQDEEMSSYPYAECREWISINGAIPSGKVITISGKKVTAENEMAATTWAEIFCKLLNGEEVEDTYVASGFDGAQRKRKLDPEIAKFVDSGK